MSGWRPRLAAGLGALILAALTAGAAGPPASAAPEPVGDCTTTSGVIVAVDFAHFGGPLLRACGTTPTTAYTLLNQGGWHTTGTEHDGPGFICRIGYAGFHGGTQYPAPAQDPCVLTPPTSAYWAFWFAGPGQNTWSYSQTGAMAIQPQPGSVELWTFGGTSSGGTSGSAVPSVSPGSLRAANARPAAAVRKHALRRTARPAAQTSPAGKAASAPASPGRSTAPARSASTAPAHSASTVPSARTTILDAPPRASAPVGHGSVIPAISALVIVALLAAAGITVVLRRPRRGQ